MSEAEVEEVVEEVAADDEGGDVLRSRVVLADGRTHDVREKWTTVVRYWGNAKEGSALLKLSTSPTTRVAVNPDALVDVLELTR
jgi:hypothetical protein